MKNRKTAVIRARCPISLKQSIEEIARLQGLESSDVIRKACKEYLGRVGQFTQPELALTA